MTAYLFALVLRQMLGRRSILIPAGLAATPVLVAIVFRLGNSGRNPEDFTISILLVGLIVTAVLPLSALLLGTSVLGDELEEGTAVYLLAKPLPRWQILLPKLLAPAIVTTVFVLLSAIASGYIVLAGSPGLDVLPGFAVALALGACAYTTVFVLLSLVSSRALIAGLIYVFIWEATITDLFTGTRYLSIRHYVLGIADFFSSTDPATFDATLGGVTAFGFAFAVTVAAAVLANQKLREIEVRESS